MSSQATSTTIIITDTDVSDNDCFYLSSDDEIIQNKSKTNKKSNEKRNRKKSVNRKKKLTKVKYQYVYHNKTYSYCE